MKNIVLLAFSLLTINCFAQRPALDKDTLSYIGKRYIVGDTVTLAYGSDPNKKFAFIQIGSALLGLSALEKGYAKQSLVLDKVYKQGGKFYMRGKLIEGSMPGYKIFIDVEGAIDNKELKE